MKVLMTCDAVGGVWQYATDLARGLAGQGVEVVLAVLGPPSRSPSGERDVLVVDTNLPLDWLADGPDDVLAAGRAIAALAAAHEVDLIHLNSPALAAAGQFPAPVVAMTHGCVGTWFAGLGEAVPPDLAWHESLVRDGLRATDAVVAPSVSYAATVQRQYELREIPLVVHNGRAPRVTADAAPADHLLTVGRLWDRAKNVALLDKVAALLRVPVRAAGAVTGPHGETIATEHLRLLGSLGDEALAAEYAAQPIFVSAARFEPFGLAVLEAAQAGCPLVLSGIDTFRELWTGAALFVSDDEPESWLAAITRVRENAGLRAHLSQQARSRAGRYSVDAMTAGTLAVYRDLLAAPERRAA